MSGLVSGMEDDMGNRQAHWIVSYARRTGKLDAQPCERCGAEPAVAHHDDYSRPLDITWLCPKHHKARHRELGWGYNEGAGRPRTYRPTRRQFRPRYGKPRKDRGCAMTRQEIIEILQRGRNTKS